MCVSENLNINKTFMEKKNISTADEFPTIPKCVMIVLYIYIMRSRYRKSWLLAANPGLGKRPQGLLCYGF